MTKSSIYPITVFKTRYGGTYESGPWIPEAGRRAYHAAEWVALHLDPGAVPWPLHGGDTDASIAWGLLDEHKIGSSAYPVGRGATPDEAVADLIRLVDAMPQSDRQDFFIDPSIEISTEDPGAAR